jgi:NADH-quinone oxidoreductase subunit C
MTSEEQPNGETRETKEAKAPQGPLATLASTQSPNQALKKTLEDTLAKVHPNGHFTVDESTTDVNVHCPPADLPALVTTLKERKELDFDYLRNMAGVDFEDDGLTCKYHFYSFKHNHSLQVTVACPPDNSHIPSLTGLYAAANWHEREAAEMFGFVFDGHPNLKNLLLEEDLRIHPLLKAHPLQKPEILQGIEGTTAGFDF